MRSSARVSIPILRTYVAAVVITWATGASASTPQQAKLMEMMQRNAAEFYTSASSGATTEAVQMGRRIMEQYVPPQPLAEDATPDERRELELYCTAAFYYSSQLADLLFEEDPKSAVRYAEIAIDAARVCRRYQLPARSIDESSLFQQFDIVGSYHTEEDNAAKAVEAYEEALDIAAASTTAPLEAERSWQIGKLELALASALEDTAGDANQQRSIKLYTNAAEHLVNGIPFLLQDESEDELIMYSALAAVSATFRPGQGDEHRQLLDHYIARLKSYSHQKLDQIISGVYSLQADWYRSYGSPAEALRLEQQALQQAEDPMRRIASLANIAEYYNNLGDIEQVKSTVGAMKEVANSKSVSDMDKELSRRYISLVESMIHLDARDKGKVEAALRRAASDDNYYPGFVPFPFLRIASLYTLVFMLEPADAGAELRRMDTAIQTAKGLLGDDYMPADFLNLYDFARTHVTGCYWFDDKEHYGSIELSDKPLSEQSTLELFQSLQIAWLRGDSTLASKAMQEILVRGFSPRYLETFMWGVRGGS